MNKALYIRIYPNKQQTIEINNTIGACRFIYNNMLAERIEVYNKLKDDKRILYEYKYKTEVDYKKDNPWLYDVSSIALQQSRIDLKIAYTNFFKSLKSTKSGDVVGFPKFKKKGIKNSYRVVQNDNRLRINYLERKITLPKIGDVVFRHNNIKDWYKTSEIRNITISKSSTGKYYASILFEGEDCFKGHTNTNSDNIIGLDMSLDKFYVDNLGNSPDYKRIFRINEKRLAKAQRKLSKAKKGSSNRVKVLKKVARIHEKITNQRKDFTHKTSRHLIDTYDVIVIESLSLKGMSQALRLGKSVQDLGYSEFVRQLEYKAKWNDKTIIKADKWFASSKLCSFCGFKNKELKLQDRVWVCPNCGKEIQRDINAGINLKNYGLGLVRPELKPVELSSLDEAVKQEAQVFRHG